MIIKKYYFWPLLALGFIVTRLTNLSIIPIFTDEAIYSYWAQVALHDPANRFISLEDGKQPLFIWFAAIIQNFVSNPLIATRLVSFFSGFASVVGIYFLAKALFNKKVAVISSILYIFLPFTLLYDRMGIFDSLLTSTVIYSVLFTVKIVKKPNFENSFLLGISLGLAAITKSSGFIFLYLLPLSLLLFNFKSKRLKEDLLKWTFFILVAAFISQVIYNSLRVSELFYLIERKNTEFIRSFSQVLKNPFLLFNSNLKSIASWIIVYLTPPLTIALISGIFLGLIKKNRQILFLCAYIFAPLSAELLFNKVLYPRFVLFYFPFIIIATAYFLNFLSGYLKNRALRIILLAIFAIMPLFISFKLITDPTNANIPKNDSGQFLNDWPAGYGVKETVGVLNKELEKGNDVYVGTEGTFGLLPYALNIYFYGNQKIHITGFWPVDQNNIPDQILQNAKEGVTYFVFNENQKKIENQNLEFVAKYKKGSGDSYMRLYKVVNK